MYPPRRGRGYVPIPVYALRATPRQAYRAWLGGVLTDVVGCARRHRIHPARGRGYVPKPVYALRATPRQAYRAWLPPRLTPWAEKCGRRKAAQVSAPCGAGRGMVGVTDVVGCARRPCIHPARGRGYVPRRIGRGCPHGLRRGLKNVVAARRLKLGAQSAREEGIGVVTDVVGCARPHRIHPAVGGVACRYPSTPCGLRRGKRIGRG